MTLIIILGIVIILALMFMSFYNNFVTLRNRVDNAWAQVDVQLQRRLDLIPNLVATVQGYATHEQSTFMAVTQARTAAMGASTPEAKMEAANTLSGTLKSLFAVAENYPDLKANQNFLDMQAQLKDTEDQISVMRQSYNDCVMAFNNAIQKFPGNIVAGIFHFTARPLFDAAAGAETAPVVSFNTQAAGTQPATVAQTPAQAAAASVSPATQAGSAAAPSVSPEPPAGNPPAGNPPAGNPPAGNPPTA